MLSLGSAGLLSLVATFEKQSPLTRKVVSFNSKSSLLKLKETSLWTQRNVSFRLFNHILSLIQTSEYAYSIIFFCLFNHLPAPAELSPSEVPAVLCMNSCEIQVVSLSVEWWKRLIFVFFKFDCKLNHKKMCSFRKKCYLCNRLEAFI